MNTVKVLFTRHKYGPMSWLIRWALPRSRFAFSMVSHCLIEDENNPDYLIQASFWHGVVRLPRAESLGNQQVVFTKTYSVPDSKAGMNWLYSQLGKKYDKWGAVGLGLNPDRKWQDPTNWFCFELAAATLANSGRDMFEENSHITGSMLLAVK